MKLPVEIVERILLKCDGKTLKTAKRVSSEWKEIVNYLSRKTPLWQWCCREEIPDKELVDYLNKYSNLDLEKWQKIYDNWVSWQNVQNGIRYDIISSPVEIPRISYIAVSGNYIAVGSEDGRVRVYSQNWKPFSHSRHKAVKVMKITFIDNTLTNEQCLVIAYPRALVIDYFQKTSNPTILEDIKDHSVYKNYICYEKIRGRISIVKLCFGDGDTKILMEIWFSRIYSPSYPTCLNIWNGVCTLLINNEVQSVNYDPADPPPMLGLNRVAKLRSSLNQISENSYQILRDDIIISLGKADSYAKEEFIEFFILGPNRECSKKLFNTWEVLNSFITCIFVYGNTLVLGVDCGNVYFYHVSCWKYFDIRHYQKKIIVGQHPIISIDVKETENERKFYVASSFRIHEIIGYEVKLDF
ncbi:hypothetical protein HHI36_010163 [Cryptolaemus montrouzieri]|uniref:F-box domain-containing protein n=1 Tax=Cryptolaemus montrouzieri TaxID=559131 RepID=A0ABD2MHY8_9CUCU